MSPISSDPPAVKIAKARAEGWRMVVLAIMAALPGTVLGIVAALRSDEKTDNEVSESAYEEQNKARREDNEQMLAWVRAEFAKRDAYLDGVLRVLPQYVVTPQGPQRRSAVVIAPPVTPSTPPKPPELSRAPELSKPESFDALAK